MYGVPARGAGSPVSLAPLSSVLDAAGVGVEGKGDKDQDGETLMGHWGLRSFTVWLCICSRLQLVSKYERGDRGKKEIQLSLEANRFE